jgi:hypothetical protein
VPFKSAQATRPSRPTGLADGLELESTPTRTGESAPRHPAVRMHWFPRSAPTGAVLGYTSVTIDRRGPFDQVERINAARDDTYNLCGQFARQPIADSLLRNVIDA